MDRIAHSTAIDIGGGRRGFRSKDTVAGLPGTVLSATHLNAEQEELVGFIEASGQTPNAEDLLQLTRGVRSQSLNYFPEPTGTANAIAIALEPGIQSYGQIEGTPLTIVPTANNTGAVTLKIGALAAQDLTTRSGIALRQSDIEAGVPITCRYDGTRFRMAHAVQSDQMLMPDVPVGALPFPEVSTADHVVALAVGSKAGSGGFLVVTGGELLQCGEDLGGGLGRLRRVPMPAADFGNANANTLAVNSTYYLRGQFSGGAFQPYLQRGADADPEPAGLLGAPNGPAGGGFDSTRIDILFAKIVTGAAGSVPTLTRLANAQRLVAYGEKKSPTLGVTNSWTSGNDSVVVDLNAYVAGLFQFDLNWARKPQLRVPSGFVWVQNASGPQFLSATSNTASVSVADRYRVVCKIESDYAEGNAWISGTLQWSAWNVGARILVEA